LTAIRALPPLVHGSTDSSTICTSSCLPSSPLPSQHHTDTTHDHAALAPAPSHRSRSAQSHDCTFCSALAAPHSSPPPVSCSAAFLPSTRPGNTDASLLADANAPPNTSIQRDATAPGRPKGRSHFEGRPKGGTGQIRRPYPRLRRHLARH
jgi:hypothetical protein